MKLHALISLDVNQFFADLCCFNINHKTWFSQARSDLLYTYLSPYLKEEEEDSFILCNGLFWSWATYFDNNKFTHSFWLEWLNIRFYWNRLSVHSHCGSSLWTAWFRNWNSKTQRNFVNNIIISNILLLSTVAKIGA